MTTVLLVDDSLTTRKMISELLIKQGFEVESASDGIQALEVLPNMNPDLIILDIIMPKMNGYEVCRTIKSNPETKNVPVIICSSKSEDFDRYWAIKQGADAYIAKPFKEKELIDTIKQFLKG